MDITDLCSYDCLDRLDDNRVILDTADLHGKNSRVRVTQLIFYDANTGDIEHKQFIYADGNLIALNTLLQDSNDKLKNKQIRYLHYDALNSVDMITDGYNYSLTEVTQATKPLKKSV